MITVFNRKELTVTFSMEDQNKIRNILAENGIDYRVKTVNRMSPSPFSAGTRCRSSSFGQDLNAMYAYKIYVKKQDYDHALKLIK